jgi:uncharacterized protein YPO0396
MKNKSNVFWIIIIGVIVAASSVLIWGFATNWGSGKGNAGENKEKLNKATQALIKAEEKLYLANQKVKKAEIDTEKAEIALENTKKQVVDFQTKVNELNKLTTQFETAKKQLTEAETAKKQLETAKKQLTEAEAAKETAETAKNKAEAAKETAETAKNKAEAAKETAETAKNKAEAAKETAEAEKNKAIQDKKTVQNAIKALYNNCSKCNSINTDKDTVQKALKCSKCVLIESLPNLPPNIPDDILQTSINTGAIVTLMEKAKDLTELYVQFTHGNISANELHKARTVVSDGIETLKASKEESNNLEPYKQMTYHTDIITDELIITPVNIFLFIFAVSFVIISYVLIRKVYVKNI